MLSQVGSRANGPWTIWLTNLQPAIRCDRDRPRTLGTACKSRSPRTEALEHVPSRAAVGRRRSPSRRSTSAREYQGKVGVTSSFSRNHDLGKVGVTSSFSRNHDLRQLSSKPITPQCAVDQNHPEKLFLRSAPIRAVPSRVEVQACFLGWQNWLDSSGLFRHISPASLRIKLWNIRALNLEDDREGEAPSERGKPGSD